MSRVPFHIIIPILFRRWFSMSMVRCRWVSGCSVVWCFLFSETCAIKVDLEKGGTKTSFHLVMLRRIELSGRELNRESERKRVRGRKQRKKKNGKLFSGSLSLVPRRADHGGIDISPICLLAHGHTQLANIPHNTRQIETIRYLLPATFSRRFTGIPSCRINYCWCVIPHTTFIPILSCDRPQLANMSHNTLHTKTINFLVSDTFAKNFHLRSFLSSC